MESRPQSGFHFTAAWLRAMYMPADAGVDQEDLYNNYVRHCSDSQLRPMTMNAVTKCIKKVFNSETRRCRRKGGDWKTYKTTYQNISPRNSQQSTIDIETELKSRGFSIICTFPKLLATKATPYRVNDSVLFKEVTVGEGGAVTLQLAGRKVAATIIPAMCNLAQPSEVEHCVSLLDEVRVCTGYTIAGKNGPEFWSKLDGSGDNSTRTFHSLGCLVCLPITTNITTTTCEVCMKAHWHRAHPAISEEQDSSDEEDLEMEDLSDLNDEDHNDITRIISSIENLPEYKESSTLLFIKAQLENRQMMDPRTRRWPQKIIQWALSIWATSPEAYKRLGDQDYLILPSGRLLQYYKNSIHQISGINPSIFQWMVQEADRIKLSKAGHSGMLSFDEVKIQGDLMIDNRAGQSNLVGFLDKGQYANDLHLLKTGLNTPELAKYVLQCVFVGHTGFRFLVAHWPTSEATAPEIDDYIWDVIDVLKLYGFVVDAVLLDGSSNNRSFVKNQFSKHPKHSCYKVPDPYDETHFIVFIMDPSHEIKKIRNSIMKSTADDQGPRLLQRKGVFILWDYWIEAYAWDSEINQGHRTHPHLSSDAINLDNASKMRNAYAFNVLNSNMVTLMKEYKSWLGSDGDYLQLTIDLLEQTKALCELFQSTQPLRSPLDQRMVKAKEALKWFQDWEDDVRNDPLLTPKERYRALISWEAREDLESAVIGIEELLKLHIKAFPNSCVTCALVNTDVVENVFCQVRCKQNGATTNPTYLQYRYTLNTIMLSNGLFKKNSNAGSNKISAMPFNVSKPNPLKKHQQLLQHPK